MTSLPITRHVLAANIVQFLQRVISQQGFDAKVHFELEGCFQNSEKHLPVNFNLLNNWLEKNNIEGKIIPEYWHNQWEFVSDFAGQSPLKEAQNLAFVLDRLPEAFRQFNFGEISIKPVIWSGDQGKMLTGSTQIFCQDRRAVHIPNAIQMNVSVLENGNNLMVERDFGERLQKAFLTTSLACCLLYLPEEEAFERFALKTQYGLFDELCSPYDISGGHQGSIAFYKDKGKHNQAMGLEPIIYGADDKVLISKQDWHATARIEHRLGAASLLYDPYINVIFALLNILDSLESFTTSRKAYSDTKACIEPTALPSSLYDHEDDTNTNYGASTLGAISLFENDKWFAEKIDHLVGLHRNDDSLSSTLPANAGQLLKKQILAKYQKQPIFINRIHL